jgi:hypothetical protein
MQTAVIPWSGRFLDACDLHPTPTKPCSTKEAMFDRALSAQALAAEAVGIVHAFKDCPPPRGTLRAAALAGFNGGEEEKAREQEMIERSSSVTLYYPYTNLTDSDLGQLERDFNTNSY